jgi:hypothetical protein
MSSMTEITCKCGCERKKMVRTADVNRGWGKYYSKSCKAKQQSRSSGGRKYSFQTLINAFNDGKISAEYAAWVTLNKYPFSVNKLKALTGIDAYEYAMTDDHPHSSEALGQW